MKKIILVVMIIIGGPHAQTVSATGAMEASSGDPIRVILNHVKADKRAQFEKFVYEVCCQHWKKMLKTIRSPGVL